MCTWLSSGETALPTAQFSLLWDLSALPKCFLYVDLMVSLDELFHLPCPSFSGTACPPVCHWTWLSSLLQLVALTLQKIIVSLWTMSCFHQASVHAICPRKIVHVYEHLEILSLLVRYLLEGGMFSINFWNGSWVMHVLHNITMQSYSSIFFA